MAPAGYIDEPTRKKLEQLAKAADKALAERDRAIMEAVESGISLRTVGGIVGLNHSTVRDIAGRQRDVLDGRTPSSYHYPRQDLDDW